MFELLYFSLITDSNIVVDHTIQEANCQKAMVFIGDETQKVYVLYFDL